MSLATENGYAKQYKTTRRTTNDEQYKLILFPDDNTISVVKSKNISPSDRGNFVVVVAGNKRYCGIVLQEGGSRHSLLVSPITTTFG